MKIDQTALAHLREAITPLDTETRRDAYRSGAFHRADRTKDVNLRYRFDLLHAAVPASWVCDELYGRLDMSDNHIDTALRSIVPAL